MRTVLVLLVGVSGCSLLLSEEDPDRDSGPSDSATADAEIISKPPVPFTCTEGTVALFPFDGNGTEECFMADEVTPSKPFVSAQTGFGNALELRGPYSDGTAQLSRFTTDSAAFPRADTGLTIDFWFQKLDASGTILTISDNRQGPGTVVLTVSYANGRVALDHFTSDCGVNVAEQTIANVTLNQGIWYQVTIAVSNDETLVSVYESGEGIVRAATSTPSSVCGAADAGTLWLGATPQGDNQPPTAAADIVLDELRVRAGVRPAHDW